MNIGTALLTGASLLLSTGDPAAPMSLSLVVVDGESGQPVQGALVTLDGARDRITDSGGRAYWETLAEGTYELTIRHLAYESVTREVGYPAVSERPLRVALTPRAFELEEVVVTGRRTLGTVRERFETRRRAGRGDFIEPEVIDERRHERLSQILERYSGLQRSCGPSGCQLVSRRATVGFGQCTPEYFLDGVRLTFPDSDSDLDHFVSAEEVGMVEVYLGPSQIPPQYNRVNSACGVVLIWTRSGVQ